MAIQVRRGLEEDLDVSKAVPGEFLVSTDSKKVRVCIQPGIIKELASAEDVADAIKNGIESIEEAEENALINISDGVDKTLSVSGKAADAKTTGDKVSQLSLDIDDLRSVVYKKIDFSIPTDGWQENTRYTDSGEKTVANYAICTKEKFAFNKDTKILLLNDNYLLKCIVYDESGSYVSTRKAEASDYDITVDCFIKISVESADKVTPITSTEIYNIIALVENEVDELGKRVTVLEEKVNDLPNSMQNTTLDENRKMYEHLTDVLNFLGHEVTPRKNITIARPNKYSAWSFLGKIGEKIICLYSRGDSHTSSDFDVYMKQSENLLLWSEERKVFDTPNLRENVTGKGNDVNGDFLFWLRSGNDENTFYELYKTDGDTFERLSNPNFSLGWSHIGDIITLSNGTLISFFNTYGDVRSWGVVKSIDNGVTWTKHITGSGLTKEQCPVEISGVEVSDGCILAIGRQDQWSETMTQHQIQSTDYGATWSIHSTNITDINSSTASVLLDKDTNTISVYYYRRGYGVLLVRKNLVSEVWNNPTNWNTSEVVAHASYSTLDAGNVNAIEFNDKQVVTFYSGNEVECGIYAVVD